MRVRDWPEESRATRQRIAYRALLAVALSHPAMEGITFWGFTDKYSWIHYRCRPSAVARHQPAPRHSRTQCHPQGSAPTSRCSSTTSTASSRRIWAAATARSTRCSPFGALTGAHNNFGAGYTRHAATRGARAARLARLPPRPPLLRRPHPLRVPRRAGSSPISDASSTRARGRAREDPPQTRTRHPPHILSRPRSIGALRILGHLPGGRTLSGCAEAALAAGWSSFGMEYPGGFNAPGKAQCLPLAAPPAHLDSAHDAECEDEVAGLGAEPLGGPYRMALYAVE